MSIKYNQSEGIFNLQTKNTSYVMGIMKDKYLVHLYYGKRVEEFSNMTANFPIHTACHFSPGPFEGFTYSIDTLSMEYPCYGSADFRTPAFHAKYENGSAVTLLEYSGFEVFDGKKPLSGLPSVYVESDDEAQTLEITLCDKLTGLEIILSYTVFSEFDVIAKSVRAKNNGCEKINIRSILSSTTYLFDRDFEFVHLEGAWARERHIQRMPIISGEMSIDSKRVSSSHFHSPFLALARTNTTENSGEVYGLSLVYSGNFIAQTETDSRDLVRVNIGINPFGFEWLLSPGEEFQTPEVILTYSYKGFGEMSKTYHKLYRTRLCRGKYRDAERPVLINNWEATYFNFDEAKIVNVAKKAKSVGVELMVLDDGWFGKRNAANSSLGDWVADPQKLPNGIDGLAQKIVDLGMDFGLWFEPEMVSEDSDLYCAHPDWCIHIDGRERTKGRNQLVLDLSRKEVRDYVVEAVCAVISSAKISYIKWDMNRNITEIGSPVLSSARQQELPHRYILGLYDVLERITTAYPDVLFEGCSGGGGRFDPGMLYYFPQYWTSDDTDAIERLYIQHGTSMVMPSSTMGAHVSAVPNHQIGRTTSLQTRGNVAMMGQFGYELDLEKLTEDEIEIVKEQIALYKSIREVIHKGDMYRLKSPFEGNNTSWEYVSEDKTRIVLMYCTISAKVVTGRVCVRLMGLRKDMLYRDTKTECVYTGEYLMNVGVYFDDDKDFESHLKIFEVINQ